MNSDHTGLNLQPCNKIGTSRQSRDRSVWPLSKDNWTREIEKTAPRGVAKNRRPSQTCRLERAAGCGLIGERRKNSAHLHRPWRATVRQSTLKRPVSARSRAITLRAATIWLRGKPVAQRRSLVDPRVLKASIKPRTTAQYHPTMTSSGTPRAAAMALSEVAEPVFLPASMSAI